MTSRPSQTSVGGAPFFYHTAHDGFATDANGKFTHFVRIPDESHRENGYWRFASSEDEHRAYARGLHTPEAILCAINYRGGAYEDINLHWVPGRVDTNTTHWPSGCAAQHLMTILDMRRFLGKSLSFRDQIPVYPVHPRLKDYWDAKCSALKSPSQTVEPAVQQSQRASLPSLVVNKRVDSRQRLSPSLLPQNSQTSCISSSDRIARSRSLSLSPRMDTNTPQANSGSSMSPQVSPVVFPTLLAPVHSVTLNLRENASCVSSDNQSNQANAASAQACKSSNKNKAHLSPNEIYSQIAPVQGVQKPQAIREPNDPVIQSLRSQISITALPAQPARATQKSLLFLNPNLPQQHTSATKTSPSDLRIKRQSSLDKNTAPLWSVFSPFASHRGRVSPYTPVVGKGASPPGKSLQARHQSRLQQREESTNMHEEAWSLTLDNDSLDIQKLHNESLIPDTILTNSIQLEPTTAPSLKPSVTLMTSVCNMERPVRATKRSPVSQPSELRTGHAESLKRPTIEAQDASRQNKKLKLNGLDHVRTTTPEQFPLASATTDMYPDLPCMDCGEDTGHKWSCHIGNLNPKQNLTILDYRILAESVERFDPGPWTTHQGLPPQPEPEDPLDQIQGMADVIRNEDSYKNNSELHSLPDGAMIMFWAFKTSPDLQVVCDFADDSGIGESEAE